MVNFPSLLSILFPPLLSLAAKRSPENQLGCLRNAVSTPVRFAAEPQTQTYFGVFWARKSQLAAIKKRYKKQMHRQEVPDWHSGSGTNKYNNQSAVNACRHYLVQDISCWVQSVWRRKRCRWSSCPTTVQSANSANSERDSIRFRYIPSCWYKLPDTLQWLVQRHVDRDERLCLLVMSTTRILHTHKKAVKTQ